MTLREQAIAADCAGQAKLAASLYEEYLATATDAEATINLVFVYWDAIDHLPNSPPGFGALASRRLLVLLHRLKNECTDDPDAIVWSAYIDAFAFGAPHPEAAFYRAVMARFPRSLTASFRLVSITKGAEAQTEAIELLRRTNAGPMTYRARYLSSVLQSALRSARSGPFDR